MSNTKIEWATRVWNVVRGCSPIRTGCKNCYAARMAARFNGPGQPYEGLARFVGRNPKWTGRVQLQPERLGLPRSWRSPQRVFVNSMSDLFHEDVPPDFVKDVFLEMGDVDHHTYMILTKRADHMEWWFNSSKAGAEAMEIAENMGWGWPLPNVILCVSAENQDAADETIPHLVATPARMRGVSLEPLIGPINLRKIACPRFTHGMRPEPPMCKLCNEPGGDGEICSNGYFDCLSEGVDWVIVGCESGPRSRIRPMSEDWVRDLRDQCEWGGARFFYKQAMFNGKKVSLPVLDGTPHAEFPL